MTQNDFENIKSYMGVLSSRMKERDKDCEDPKTAVDKGYSLAVQHMTSEIETILADLKMQIYPRQKEEVHIDMKEIKINEVVLKFNDSEKFQKIKEHMEVCGEEELNNEFVAMQLIEIGMNAYKFI